MNNTYEEAMVDSEKNLDDITNDFDKAIYLQELLINMSTNDGPASDNHYMDLRKHFRSNIKIKKMLPHYIINNRNLNQFWQFIKNKFPTYEERRQFIRKDFSVLLEYLEELEEKKKTPFVESIDESLRLFSSDHVLTYWNTALERKSSDPEGAITISRTMVEGVLKHILEDNEISYSNSASLHDLYKLVSDKLNLSAEQHDSKVFKQILGGSSSIISGLGNLRNIHGDAHGKGKKESYKPSMRHAELAVNLAGTMSLFLIQTYQEKERFYK